MERLLFAGIVKKDMVNVSTINPVQNMGGKKVSKLMIIKHITYIPVLIRITPFII